MGKFYCGVPQCKSLAGTTQVKFHLFPKDPILGKKWDEILKRAKPHSRHSKICELHFVDSDYQKPLTVQNPDRFLKRKKLKLDAIPSRNLPRLNWDGTVIKMRKKVRIKKDSHNVKDQNSDSVMTIEEKKLFSSYDDDVETMFQQDSQDCLNSTPQNLPYHITDTGVITYTPPVDVSESTIPLHPSIEEFSDMVNSSESVYMDEFSLPLDSSNEIFQDNSVHDSSYSDTENIEMEQCEPKYITLQPVVLNIFLS